MRKFWIYHLGILATCLTSFLAYAQSIPSQNLQNESIKTPTSTKPQLTPNSGQSLRIGIVNTKKCFDASKFGKQEQQNFEKMKSQMENVLKDKEMALEEVEAKLNDDDYMDSVSDETENELKRKRRSIRNEGMQLQSQYMQTLQKANLSVIQKLADSIAKASAQVAQDPTNGFDVILSDEACTFFTPRLDVSDRIITKMNAMFDTEQKENATKNR